MTGEDGIDVPAIFRAPIVEDWLEPDAIPVVRLDDGTVDLDHRHSVALSSWLRWRRARSAWAAEHDLTAADLRRLPGSRSPRWRHPLTEDDLAAQKDHPDGRP